MADQDEVHIGCRVMVNTGIFADPYNRETGQIIAIGEETNSRNEPLATIKLDRYRLPITCHPTHLQVLSPDEDRRPCPRCNGTGMIRPDTARGDTSAGASEASEH